MQLSVYNIHSLKKGDFQVQLQDCICQIIDEVLCNLSNRKTVKITVFTKCTDSSDYLIKMKLLETAFYQDNEFQAPVSLVSQPPMDCSTMIEVWMLDYVDSPFTFRFERGEQTSVLHLESTHFDCLFSTHHSAKLQNFKENANKTFGLLDATLKEWAFDYNQIVRQWNYIENIILLDTLNYPNHQNYQLFNDLRSLYYKNSSFTHGYPSATGIGTNNGGCTIEAIAVREKKTKSIMPVANTMQIDAHTYSSTLLVGHAIEETGKVSTPKFERGKFMQLADEGFLFVSGTASIKGEQSVFTDDISNQTITTLRNIDNLVSVDNLNKNNIHSLPQLRLLNYRVYLKDEKDYSFVKSMCEAHFGFGTGFIVKADICRDNLLIEIEANYVA